MSRVVVFASFYPKKEKINEVKSIILEMVKPTRFFARPQLFGTQCAWEWFKIN